MLIPEVDRDRVVALIFDVGHMPNEMNPLPVKRGTLVYDSDYSTYRGADEEGFVFVLETFTVRGVVLDPSNPD